MEGHTIDCKKCGVTLDVPEGLNSVFCAYCGTKNLVTDILEIPGLTLLCLKCNTKNKDENIHCSKCGSKLQRECPFCNQNHPFTTNCCPKTGENIEQEIQKRKKAAEDELINKTNEARRKAKIAINSWDKILEKTLHAVSNIGCEISLPEKVGKKYIDLNIKKIENADYQNATEIEKQAIRAFKIIQDKAIEIDDNRWKVVDKYVIEINKLNSKYNEITTNASDSKREIEWRYANHNSDFQKENSVGKYASYGCLSGLIFVIPLFFLVFILISGLNLDEQDEIVIGQIIWVCSPLIWSIIGVLYYFYRLHKDKNGALQYWDNQILEAKKIKEKIKSLEENLKPAKISAEKSRSALSIIRELQSPPSSPEKASSDEANALYDWI